MSPLAQPTFLTLEINFRVSLSKTKYSSKLHLIATNDLNFKFKTTHAKQKFNFSINSNNTPDWISISIIKMNDLFCSASGII